jgi:hypothetical protein
MKIGQETMDKIADDIANIIDRAERLEKSFLKANGTVWMSVNSRVKFEVEAYLRSTLKPGIKLVVDGRVWIDSDLDEDNIYRIFDRCAEKAMQINEMLEDEHRSLCQFLTSPKNNEEALQQTS